MVSESASALHTHTHTDNEKHDYSQSAVRLRYVTMYDDDEFRLVYR